MNTFQWHYSMKYATETSKQYQLSVISQFHPCLSVFKEMQATRWEGVGCGDWAPQVKQEYMKNTGTTFECCSVSIGKKVQKLKSRLMRCHHEEDGGTEERFSLW